MADRALWEQIRFPFEPERQPASLQQIVDDIELWPRGKGFVLYFLSDGRKEAILRDADGRICSFEESTITFANVPIRLESIEDLRDYSFGLLGTLGYSFEAINSALKQAKEAKEALVPEGDDSGQTAAAAIISPVIVVQSISNRTGRPNALLPQRPVAIRTGEAWDKLQAVATDAEVPPVIIQVFGVDASKYIVRLWIGEDSD